MKTLRIGCLALALAGCATDEIALRPLPAAGDPSTEVTVLRPRTVVAAEWPFYIVVADQPVFDLRNGEHTRFRMSSGRQVLAIRCQGGPASKPLEARVEHDFPPGGSAYFVVEPKFECASVQSVSASSAAPVIATTRFRALGAVNLMAQATGDAPAVFSSQPAPPRAAATSVHEQIAAATAAWVDAFNKRDAARIAQMYDPEAVIWGTDAQRLAAGPSAIAEYFKSLAAPQRVPVTAAIGEQRIRVYGDTAIDTGTYTFWVTRDGKQEPVPARYSLVYRNHEGKWLIVDHHSSRVPAP
ncbi:MAG TPA: SgcJ/EcaC family oxidoreductase [Burkholderiales bacterium]|nr:SgcJ/EcaC family oxidoreductase [Burkholderiales bacterium]